MELLARKSMLGSDIDLRLTNSREHRLLLEELDVYADATDSGATPIIVTDDPDPTRGARARNPGIHWDFDDGFTADYETLRVRYRFERKALREIIISAPFRRSWLRTQLSRARSPQFTASWETIGQRFHELVLVPIALLHDELVPIHATMMTSPMGNVVALGGTGGAGKTTAELHLCRRFGFHFMADDIGVLDRAGRAHPNLAYPKVYGYNAIGDAELERTLLQGRSHIDRLHWKLALRVRPDRVRRRMDPRILFEQVDRTARPLSTYILIIRTQCSEPRFRDLRLDTAVDASTEIMASEYGALTRHLAWHVVNRLAFGRDPVVTTEGMLASLRVRLRDALGGARLVALELPMELSHADYVRTVVPRIREVVDA